MDAFEITALVGGLIMLGFGGLCLFAPGKAKALPVRYLPKRISQGKGPTPFQEKILYRLTGVGLLLLAFILLKGTFTR